MPTRERNNRKKFVELVSSIEKSNRAFKKASPSKKIVMVARDVIALIKLERLEVKHGVYVIMSGIDKFSPETQVQDIIKMPTLPACQVCAIGGAMVAATLRLNQVQVGDIVAEHTSSIGVFFNYSSPDFQYDNAECGMSNRATDIFPHRLLREMEDAFERGYYGYDFFSYAKDRLIAIYQNLIDNEGKKFTEYREPNVDYDDADNIIWSITE